MGKIHVLDRETAEKIAAGEVVERPASVVKELLENALDAGATAVTVEIQHGGVRYIRVTDDGCGIAAEDAPRAFLRHATSKIQTARDLEAIGTLGFRGEALCSIAAVSQTELLTKERGAPEGVHLVMRGGAEVTCAPAGCPEGTTVLVKELFFNTPARMKFLKKDATEAAYVADVCQKEALGHPEVSIRLIRDGKEVFFTPGDNRLEHAVQAIYGRDVAREMLAVDAKGAISVRGVTGSGALSRPNRNLQIFFVNGRYIQNKTLSVALGEAYKNELMIGRFPAAVLSLTLDPSLVDVNVHPAKTEVKFQDDHAVYDAMYWAVRNAVKQEAGPRPTQEKRAKAAYVTPLADRSASLADRSALQQTVAGFSSYQPRTVQPPVGHTPSWKKSDLPRVAEVAPPLEQSNDAANAAAPFGATPTDQADFPQAMPRELARSGEEMVQPVPAQDAASPQNETFVAEESVRIIGQLFATYIVVQKGDNLILMDQHAAHERLHYEAMRAQGGKSAAQTLLVPISVTTDATETAAIEANRAFLEDLGFEMEPFGEQTWLLRALPGDIAFEDGKDVLLETLSVLSHAGAGELSERRDKAIYTVACKSAIRANHVMTTAEMERLYHDAAAMEGISTCPHGRPICISMTKRQIEKLFHRIQ